MEIDVASERKGALGRPSATFAASPEPGSNVDVGAEPFRARQRGIVGGVIAGFVGLGCCVGPAIAASVGVMSATAALDAANHLYNEWGSLFKALGLTAAGVAVVLTLRRRKVCRAQGTSLRGFFLWLVASGVATYSFLYVLTTWLGALAN